MPFRYILKNKLLLQKNYNCQEESIDKWPYWLFEENIKIVNELSEEENNNRNIQEKGQQDPMGSFDANSIMSSAKNMTNNIPKM